MVSLILYNINMDPEKILFNALIVGPTNCGKTKYIVNQLCGPFRGKFDYIVLVCPTFVHTDDRVFIVTPEQDTVDTLPHSLSFLFEGTNTLLIIDDCAVSKDMKGRSNQLVNLAFSARHIGISVWVTTQQFTSITKTVQRLSYFILLLRKTSRVFLKVMQANFHRLKSKNSSRVLNHISIPVLFSVFVILTISN